MTETVITFIYATSAIELTSFCLIKSFSASIMNIHNYVALFIVYLVFFIVHASLEELTDLQCPVKCECLKIKQNDVTKMKCSSNQWTEEDLNNRTVFMIPLQIQQLDLSNNKISRLYPAFLSLLGLKKLNLSENEIKIIDPGAFSNLVNLQNLDLSANDIEVIPKNVFAPLEQLQRLKLRKNKLRHLDQNVLFPLLRLNLIDLSENPWHCDCDIFWLSTWTRSTSIKLSPPPKCESPSKEAGILIKKLTLDCTKNSHPELSPSNSQVVFAGDSLALRCRSGRGAERVRWAWENFDPKTKFAEVNVTDLILPEHGWVESWLRIKSLEPEHSGDWTCQQIDGENRSAVVSVLVLSSATRFCSEIVTTDNKGVYFWPRTVVGHSVERPCEVDKVGREESFAIYSCNLNGTWEKLNTSQCPFVSERTKILEQFSLETLTVGKDNALLFKSKTLKNLTEAMELFTDPMDIVFLARTLEKYIPYVATNRELGAVLVDVITSLLRLHFTVFQRAQIEDKSCSKIVAALETITSDTSFQYHGPFVALEEFDVPRDRFSGLTCIWKQIPISSTQQFHCTTTIRPVLNSSGHEVQAAIQLPSSIFQKTEPSIHKLIITMFANANFFPDSSLTAGYIKSAVVGANIVASGLGNLSEPVIVMTQITHGFISNPVWWDDNLNDGIGGWSSKACHPSHTAGNLFVFHCNRLGYYAVLHPDTYIGRGFSTAYGHATLYSGSCVLLACLLMAVITYTLSHGAVQMSRRAKHAAVNTWIALGLLCFLFSFGMFATDDVRTCEIVGLALHYFSMSALLWMTVAANHMYKRLSRGSTEHVSDEIPESTPMHKPILGLYLVGWGIGLIICGISGAVHLRDYANSSFCFLGAGPALSAVLVPTAILVTVLTIFYFLSLCAIRNNDVNGQLSEGTQGTEHVDLELLDDGAACADRQSTRSVVTDSEDIEDVEHSPLIQLKAHIIVLVLFLLLWCSAALAVTSVMHPFISQQEVVGSSFYCLIAFCLGAFILYFYCVARSDVRARWGAWRRRRCCRSRSISDTRASLPLQATAPTLLSNGPPSVNSGVTVRSNSSLRTKAVTELNNSERADSSNGKPTNNVNLVVMHRQIYRSNNSMPTYHEVSGQDWADAFYNPRQSIVAKKFFKKQRRNRRNELGLRRRGDGGGTSEGEASNVCRTWRPSAESAVFLSSDMENNSEKIGPSIFGYGSKINNTNIHVGQNSRRRNSQSPKDPNVLSEEEAEKNSSKILLARLVIGAEGEASGPSVALARLDEEPLAPDCRSIELQCSLGDSSDIQDGDDSFSQKIDDMRLQSDQSCTDSPVSPPQYVTVLDPKYGVVKVTMSDYYQQSHRLSLASSTGEPVADFQKHSLPSTPEELEEREDTCSSDINEPNRMLTTLSHCNVTNGDRLEEEEDVLDILSIVSSNNISSKTNSPRMRSLDWISMPKNYIFTKKCAKRRSLPSSPEGRGRDPRLSLPSSPEGRDIVYPRVVRQYPRFSIPPPPAEDYISSVPHSEIFNGEPDSCLCENPPSPSQFRKSERLRPKSEVLGEQNNSEEEAKKETSV